MRGCRCLEIDCWDGDEDEPVVYHGHTLTSKLLFRTVISVIGHYAFQASPYPLILSLENHCSPRQQEVMAKHLTSILGERLLTTTVPESGSRFLPSPETLIGKILVKHKKVGPTQSSAPSTPSQVGECVEQAKNTKKIKFYLKIRRKIAEPKITQVQKTELAMALSDLVIYTQSKKFISFQHSREHQKFYENNSLSEQEAKKLSRHSVALNFQTPGVAMDLQDGRFLDNGRCGYVLKPEYLRTEGGRFHPHAQRHRTRPMFFTIKVISGFLLPHRSFSKTNTTSLIVTVEIYGTPADEGRKQTYEVKNNAFNPQWAQSLTFSVQVPELALLRFCLEDRSPLGSSELLGQYTLPLTSLGKGYRHVPLLNKHGQSLAPACLYVHVWYP
ncbi:1-phosphatidylinositol 4,5-bisphosphate phosphodiesterase zeta-1 isoform X2 [Leptodactylus fuscus]|uniref:1-phosphatidylinositol 4,5-bisphosphate phosphodiesterase zeta-1 isoform X2 n=1 Tax=Leptodactylus fuscus TaxID=238119 RepID=UPI003F4E8B3D